MKATWKGRILAESSETIEIEGNHYFPPDSIDRDYFKKSDHRSTCPWKGEGYYYDVVVDGETNRRAAWYYPSPKEAAEEIAGYVAFWRGIEVTE